MNIKRTALSAAIVSILGATNGIGVTHAAVEPGAYDLVILTTPVNSATLTSNSGATSVTTSFNVGVDGNWQSTFTFGGSIPGSVSQGMTDTGDMLAVCGPAGSGIPGDGFAGILGINISTSGAITVSSFAKDLIFGTAGGSFVQYITSPTHPIGDTSQMTGNIDLNTGAMTLVPRGRLGAVEAPTPLCDRRWNVDDAVDPVIPGDVVDTDWKPFTTASVSAAGTGGLKPINGKPFIATADQNGDGIADYLGVLVTGEDIGSDWGSFFDADFFEVWRVRLLSKGPRLADDSAASFLTTPRTISVLANDRGKPPLTIDDPLTPNTSAQGGTVVVNTGASPNTITYTAPSGFTGPDTFTYTARDFDGNTDTATVSVNVSAQSALAEDDTGVTKQGQPVTIDVVNDDSSVIGTLIPGSVAIASQGAKGTAVSNGDGTVTYTPIVDFVGQDSFTYTIQDDVPSTSDPATVTVDVAGGPLVSAGTYGNGTIATNVGATDGVIAADDVPMPDAGVTTPCLGGCFDFVVTGAAASTQIVLPRLSTPLDTSKSIRYRKFAGGAWKDFDTSGGDSIASTTITTNGGCPAPGAGTWIPWTGATAGAANNGHDCVRLTISDNGTNDTNTTTLGTIADPGGPGQFIAALQPSGTIDEFRKSTSGGCTIGGRPATFTSHADWAILGLFGAWLGAFRLRRKISR